MTTSNDPDEIRAEIERTRAALSNDVDTLTDTANPKNIASRQADKVKDTVGGAIGGVKDKIMGTTDAASDAVGEKAELARRKASDAGDAVAAAPGKAKSKTQGNPLAAGLIAFGAGLLISSLIPSSQKEQDAVSGLQQNLEPLKEKATEAAKEVAGNLKAPAQEAAQSVKETATDGAQNVKEEGVAAKEQVQDQAQSSKETVQEHATS